MATLQIYIATLQMYMAALRRLVPWLVPWLVSRLILSTLAVLLMAHTAFAQSHDHPASFGTMLTEQLGIQSLYAPLLPEADASDEDAHYGGGHRITTQFALDVPLEAGEGFGESFGEDSIGWYRLGFRHWRRQNQCQNQNLPCLWFALPLARGFSDGN